MIHISFTGDIKLLNVEGLKVSEEIADILDRCEYNVINFEAPVAFEGQIGIEKSGPNISQCIESSSWVENNGWNVVSLANNHAMDYGDEGLKHTMRSFKSAHLFGAGSWEDAYKPLFLTASGGVRLE